MCCKDSNVGKGFVMTLMELNVVLGPSHFVVQTGGGSGMKG